MYTTTIYSHYLDSAYNNHLKIPANSCSDEDGPTEQMKMKLHHTFSGIFLGLSPAFFPSSVASSSPESTPPNAPSGIPRALSTAFSQLSSGSVRLAFDFFRFFGDFPDVTDIVTSPANESDDAMDILEEPAELRVFSFGRWFSSCGGIRFLTFVFGDGLGSGFVVLRFCCLTAMPLVCCSLTLCFTSILLPSGVSRCIWTADLRRFFVEPVGVSISSNTETHRFNT